MCGIIACISNNNCHDILYNGLVQLKNRGYDSVGIATIYNDKFINNKFASTEQSDSYIKLKSNLNQHENSTIGIGHTRWATHGFKTDENSHPHISMCGKFAIVHNGIIENFKHLKDFLIKNNFTFKSQTDTEIIVNLLSYYYNLFNNNENNNENNIIKSINKTISMLEGTWGLVIMSIDNPTKLYCIRHGSPIVIGYDDEKCIVSSEISGFCNLINNYFILDDSDICEISLKENTICINTNISYDLRNLETINNDLTPEPYEHWTIKEIYEQKYSSMRAISMGGRILEDNKIKLGGLDNFKHILNNIDNIILLGCGTSYFSSMYASHIFKELCNFNTTLFFDGADFNSDDIPKIGKTACIFISQSGETTDLYRCIAITKKHNIFNIGVINVVDSLIAREVDCGCYLNAGKEVGVASTKAYTSQVILLTMMALWFSQQQNGPIYKRKQYIKDLRHLTIDIEKTFNLINNDIDNVVHLLNSFNNNFILGKGKCESVAKEAALKIKEITYIHSEGYSTSSLRHGPFAMLDAKFPVILLAPENNHFQNFENVYQQVYSRKAPIIVITDSINYYNNNNNNYVLRIANNKSFKELLCILPIQIIAYKLSLLKNINPDTPRNLAKVVSVE